MNILGLLVASAIPVVGFMLWAEYFKQELGTREEGLKGQSPSEQDDLEMWVARLRLAGLLTTSFQLVIFLATSETRNENSLNAIAGVWITLAAFVIQRFQQAGLEQRVVRERSASPKALPSVLGPSLIGAFAGLVIYLSLLGGTLLTTALAIAVFKWTGIKAAIALGGGTLLGYTAALASNFIFSPWLLKMTIPSRELPDGPAREILESCFARAKISAPEFRLADPSSVRAPNAWVTGFAWLRGPLRPVLWVSPKLLEELEPEELEAVISHEMVHLKKNHLTLRFALAWAMSLLVLISLSGTFVLGGAASGPIAPAFSLFLAVAMIWGSFRALEEQSHSHELEADFLSVTELGASAVALASALEKTHAGQEGGTHPLLAVRLQALRPLIQRELDSDAFRKPDTKKAA